MINCHGLKGHILKYFSNYFLQNIYKNVKNVLYYSQSRKIYIKKQGVVLELKY